MVLFVFVIMLLNAGVEEETKGSRVALLFGIPGVLTGQRADGVGRGAALGDRGGADRALCRGIPQRSRSLLFHDFLLPFEITSVLILIAIMGAVVLASKPDTRTGEEGGLMVPSYGATLLLSCAQRIFICLRRGRISDQAQHHHHLHVD